MTTHMEKTCTKCWDEKPLNDFVKDRNRSDGRGSWCRLCHRAVSRKSIKRWREKNLKTYLSDYFDERYLRLRALKAEPCMDCGETYPWYVMDFDHRDRATKIGCVATMVRQTIAWERVLAEISKCDLVCVCCHRLRTYGVGGRNKSKADRLILTAKDTPCPDCGRTLEPCQMDFDHVSGDKIACVSQMRQGTIEALHSEILKCEVVCANCHRARTYSRRAN